ncbi:hypothetical protein ACFU3O_35670, partial [Streptomyces antibioticus]
KLEQERLVYQARLRSRFGRAWRRKAPVESLMPLRLARYGVPLAETAPAGLAAAGIAEPPAWFTTQQTPAPAQRHNPELIEAPAGQEQEPVTASGPEPQPVQQTRVAQPEPTRGLGDEGNARHIADAYRDWTAVFGHEPTNTQFAIWLQDRYGIATAAGRPLSAEHLEPLLKLFKLRHTPSAEIGTDHSGVNGADESWSDYFYNAWHVYAHEHGVYPDAAMLARYVYERDRITGGDGRPFTGEDLEAFVSAFRPHEFDEAEPPADAQAAESIDPPPDKDDAEQIAVDSEAPDPAGRLPDESESQQTPDGAGAHPAKGDRTLRVNAAIGARQAGAEDAVGEPAMLTTVDRYYLAWMAFQSEHGDEPTGEQLSAYLARQGMHGRGGKPVSPANLRRYFLPYRVYNVWAEHRLRDEQPAADAVAQDCAARGITAQYNKPVTLDYITANATDFERRRQALTRHTQQ